MQFDWDDLKVFTGIARGGSVRRAAAQLGIHASTVARRLEQLEQNLGVRLFDRTPRGLRLTRDGEDVLGQAERVGNEIAAIERRVTGRDRRLAGRVRVTLPDAVAAGFLMSELARFSARYPDIELELIPSYEPLDLASGEADLAIRVTDSPPENLVGRPLGRFAMALYAEPGYLVGRDPVGEPASAGWIGWNEDGFVEELRVARFNDMPVSMRCGSVLLQLGAAVNGVGVALLPCALGDPHPGLVRVRGFAPVEGPPMWGLMHPDLRSSVRVRTLLSFVVETFEDRRDLLLGRGAWDQAVLPAA